MSRRIAYLFAAAGCLTFIAPAGADPECFDGACRMPQVMEAPEPQAPSPATEEKALAKSEPQPVRERVVQEHVVQERLGPAPEPIRPQMRVDNPPRPALRPMPGRSIEKTAEKPTGTSVRQAAHQVQPAPEPVDEPVEVVSRRYAAAEPPQGYVPQPLRPVPPSAGVVVVAPGAQYGADGIEVANARQDSSWQLCQVDRPGPGHNRCIQYNYQPYGAYGYRPLGTYKAYKPSPSYVYVPDAKVITID